LRKQILHEDEIEDPDSFESGEEQQRINAANLAFLEK